MDWQADGGLQWLLAPIPTRETNLIDHIIRWMSRSSLMERIDIVLVQIFVCQDSLAVRRRGFRFLAI